MSAFKLQDKWTPKHMKTFLNLKIALTSRPVLQALRYDGSPFIITTDGCQEGMGAVLTQCTTIQTPSGKWVNKILPIAFASKWTSTSEKNYKPFLLEFAALKYGLDQFSDIIWGFPIEIKTDCQVLKDVLANPQASMTHARWRDGIVAHNIVAIQHVPGRLNVVADGLSRQWDNTKHLPMSCDGSEWSVSPDPES